MNKMFIQYRQNCLEIQIKYNLISLMEKMRKITRYSKQRQKKISSIIFRYYNIDNLGSRYIVNDLLLLLYLHRQNV